VRVASIYSLLGEEAEAKANYRQALKLFRELTIQFPDEADYRCHLARCVSEMAYLSSTAALRAESKPAYFDTVEENEEAFREAIRLQEKLVSDHPTELDYQRDLAESYFRLGHHLHDYPKRYEDAERLCRSARIICERLVEEYPTVLSYQQDLCDLLGMLGGTLMDAGKLQEAEACFRESLKRRRKLVDDFPGRRYPRALLGWGHHDLGTFLANVQRFEEASESFRQAIEVRANLVAVFPGVRGYRINLGHTYAWLADVTHRAGRVQETEQACEKAVILWEGLLRDYPEEWEYAVELSGIQVHLADLVIDRGQSEMGLTLVDRAIPPMKNLLAKDPRNRRARQVVQQALGERADVLIGLGRLKELEETYRDLDQHFRKGTELDPDDFFNWFCNAPLRLHQGDVEGYRLVCREMLARFSQTDKYWIAESTAKTCVLRPDAVSDFGPVQQLAARAIAGSERTLYYGWYLLTKGMADYRARDFPSAITQLTTALSVANDPRQQNRENSDPALAGKAYIFLAMAHHQLGHGDEAQQAFGKATQLIDQMGRKPGPNTLHRTGWGNWLRFCLVYREAEQLLRSPAEVLK
jgi:tetratricopeptide (TPR) repeat protein